MSKEKKKDEGAKEKSMNKEILQLAAPNIISNMSTPLIGLVDSFVAGHLGKASLNAVAVGVNTFNLLYNVFIFLRKSTTGLASQALGREDHDEIRATSARSIGIGFLIGVVILIFQDPLMGVVFDWLRPPDYAYEECVNYYKARVLGAPFALGNFAVQGFLNGMKRSKQVLCQQIVLNVCNATLCILLASEYGPWKLGVTGIGYAAAIANAVAFVNGMGQVYICLHGGRGSEPLPGKWDIKIIFAAGPLKEMFALGGAVTLRSLCLTLTQTGFTAIASRITTLENPYLAANLLLLQLHQLFATGVDGFSNAAEALVGEAIGKKDRKRLYAVVKLTCAWGFGIALTYSCLWYSIGPYFFEAMTDAATRSAADEADKYLWWVVIGSPFGVWAFLMDGFFVGATLAKAMLYSMVFATSMYVITVYIIVGGNIDLPTFGPLPFSCGNNGLWVAFYSFLVYRAIGLAAQWRSLDNKLIPPEGYIAIVEKAVPELAPEVREPAPQKAKRGEGDCPCM